jgi:zinc/manganese transport system permease protein
VRLPLDALVYGVIIAVWFGLGERIGRAGFYVLFACAVTVSVQLVGLYLVFATLVIPALATFYARRRRLAMAYAIGVLGYAAGLSASAASDLPSGPMIVCAMGVVGALAALSLRRQ